MKKILFISYYYPPLTDVGCKRSVAFSKYLKRYGWSPYILSVKNPDKVFCSVGNDRPPPGIYIEHTYSVFNPYKFIGKINGLVSKFFGLFGGELKRNYFYHIFCIPDIFWGWIPLTMLKGYKLIRKFNIDIIYVSCAPYSSAIIGVFLKAITKKPLIIDFRDAYALERNLPDRVLPPLFRKRLDKWIVNGFLKYTDIFIVVTNEIKELYIDQYPQVRDKIFTLYNGFDPELIPKEKPSSKYSKFTIVYAGQFFYALGSEIFFESLALLKKEERIHESNFQFLFYGKGEKRIDQISKDYNIEELVIASSRISSRDVYNIISKSHLQLLKAMPSAAPTKLIEGIQLNVPFLATIPPGEAEDIIRKYSPSSYIITEESAEKVAEAIIDAMAKYKKGEIYDNHFEEFLDTFSRESLTLKLMGIIETNLNSPLFPSKYSR